MKRFALLGVLALAACGADPTDYPSTREEALARGQNTYYITANNAVHRGIMTAVFIDPRTGCEYWADDSQPRNDASGQQVCLPIDNTPRLVAR